MTKNSDKKRLSDRKIAIILLVILIVLISIIICILTNNILSATVSEKPIEATVKEENSQPQEKPENKEDEPSEDVKSEEVSQKETQVTSSNITSAIIESTKSMLGVPSDLKVTHSVSSPYYWEGGGIYLVHISFYYNGEVVASADINAKTGSPEKSFLMYSPPEEDPTVDEIYSYDGYDPDYVYVPEEDEIEHYEPAPGSAPPEGFDSSGNKEYTEDEYEHYEPAPGSAKPDIVYESDYSSTDVENNDLEE